MKIKKYSTYRGHKLENCQQEVLKFWQDEKVRKIEMKFIKQGIPKKDFDTTFFGVIERDRLEAERTGKKWPEDYVKKMN